MPPDRLDDFISRDISAGQSGFSLVEVVTAAVILGIAVSALTIMMGNADILGLASDHYRQARILAQHELEDPWSHFLNYDDAPPNPTEDMYLDLNEQGRVSLLAHDVNTKTNHFADLGDGINIPYKTVRSTVTWTEKTGKTLSLTLSKRIVQVP